MLEKPWVRWGFAVLMLSLAAGINVSLQPSLSGRAPLLPYFPALIAIGLVGGAWPAIAALLLAAFVVATWSIEPIGRPWPIDRPSDAILLLAFLLGGGAAIAVAGRLRGI